MTEVKYWVARWDNSGLARVYGLRNFHPPKEDNPTILWRGDDYHEALAVCKRINQEARETADAMEGVDDG